MPMNYDYKKYQTLLRIEQLVDKLVEQQEQNRLCCRCVSLSVTPVKAPVDNPEPEPGETYDRTGAALFLQIKDKKVYRLRIAGKLLFYKASNGKIRYRQADLEVCYKQIWGFPRPE